MKTVPNVLIVVLSLAVAFFTASYVAGHHQGAPSSVHESAYERIIRTGVIRCGYIVYPPYLSKDVNSGTMSGSAFDFMQAIARELNVRVEWAEETGWGTFHEGLNGNRYDLMCVPVWESGARARIALLTKPLYYNPLYAFARVDDNRFDLDPESINKPNIKVAVGAGNPTQETLRMRFPLAQELAIPDYADSSSVLMNLTTGKADVALENLGKAQLFNAGSNNKVKVTAGGQPLRVFSNVIAMREGEFELKAALDSVIDTLTNSSEAATIVKKYAASGIQGPIPGYATTASP